MSNTLTTIVPNWYLNNKNEYYREIKEYFTNLSYSDRTTICIYSNAVKRVIVESRGNNGEHRTIGIYDFESHNYNEICHSYGGHMLPSFYIASKDKNTGGFAYFNETYYNRITGETTYGPVIILDSKFNNAPNIRNIDGFDKNMALYCHIINEYLYFEYKGVRYLIDGDYKIIAKLPYEIDEKKNRFVKKNTTQLILKYGENKRCLYDITSKKVIFDDITDVSEETNPDFIKNGDIYCYDDNVGKFVLLSKYDSFVKQLTLVDEILYNDEAFFYKHEASNNRDYVYVYADQNNGKYLVHNNKVINKHCPFDKVVQDKDKAQWVCYVNGFRDVYIGYEKWKFGNINLNGDETEEKLWFDTEE